MSINLITLPMFNENITASGKTKPVLDSLIGNMGLQVTQELVVNFESWKLVFIEPNESHDIIYLQTRGAIIGWDHDEAMKNINQYKTKHEKIPQDHPACDNNNGAPVFILLYPERQQPIYRSDHR